MLLFNDKVEVALAVEVLLPLPVSVNDGEPVIVELTVWVDVPDSDEFGRAVGRESMLLVNDKVEVELAVEVLLPLPVSVDDGEPVIVELIVWVDVPDSDD